MPVMAGAVAVQSEWVKRRRRSALFSLLAAAVMVVLFGWALSAYGDRQYAVEVWLVTIGLPPTLVSLAAAAQYRWRDHSGAGAAAAVLYWVFAVVLLTRAGGPFIMAGLLQTYAWFVSRPGREDRQDQRAGQPPTIA